MTYIFKMSNQSSSVMGAQERANNSEEVHTNARGNRYVSIEDCIHLGDCQVIDEPTHMSAGTFVDQLYVAHKFSDDFGCLQYVLRNYWRKVNGRVYVGRGMLSELNHKSPKKLYIYGRDLGILVKSKKVLSIGAVSVADSDVLFSPVYAHELRPHHAYPLAVLGSCVKRRTLIMNPASETVTNPDDASIECDVTRVTHALSQLIVDPDNAARVKNVELAFLAASTIVSDKFWKKLIAGVLTLLGLVVQKPLLAKMWEVITMTFFEGNKISSITEMLKSLKQSTVSKSVKQFLATFLVPIVGDQKLTLGEVEFLSISGAEKATGLDLASCIFETIDYMIHASEYLATHGSLIGFLVPTTEMTEFVEKYWDVIDMYDKIKLGQGDTELPVAYEMLQELQIECVDLKKIVRDTHGQRQLSQSGATIAARLRECQALMSEGAFKKMPFSIYLYGPTRCGKTTVTNLILEQLSDALSQPINPGTKATISGASKFMTELRPTTKWVVIDDVASVKPEFVTDPPAEVFLRLVNNVVTSLNQASVERKGEPAPRPHAVVCTSNVYDMGAVSTQNDPRPILARIHMHIEMNVRKGWLDGNGLWDAKKFFEEFNAGGLPDAWEFTVRTMVPDDEPVYSKTSNSAPMASVGGVNFMLRVIEDPEYGVLEKIGIDKLMLYMRAKCLENATKQAIAQELLATQTFETHFCGLCKVAKDRCSCVTNDDTEPVCGDNNDETINECEHSPKDTQEVKRVKEDPPTTMCGADPPNVTTCGNIAIMNPADAVSEGLASCAVRGQVWIESKTLDSKLQKTGTIKEHCARIVGFDVEKEVLWKKILLLASHVCESIARTRVLHYATWMSNDPPDTTLHSMVSVTNENEISLRAYTYAFRKLIPRLIAPSCSIASPACGAATMAIAPFDDAIEKWIYDRYLEWKNAEPGNDAASKFELLLKLSTGAVFATMALPVCGPALISFSMFLAEKIIACCSPIGCALFGINMAYAGIMFARDVRIERKVIINEITDQIRYMRAIYKPYREKSYLLTSAAMCGCVGAGIWATWSDAVEMNPASTLTRDPFYYDKWTKLHMPDPSVYQKSNELVNSVKNNVVHLEYDLPNGDVRRTCATGVQTSRMLVSQHFLPTVPTEIRLIRSPKFVDGVPVNNATIRIAFENDCVFPLGNTDMTLLRTKERVQFRDIVDRFANGDVPASSIGSTIIRSKNGGVEVRDVCKIKKILAGTRAVNRLDGKPFPPVVTYQFEGITNYGECGAPLLVGHKRSAIYGIFNGKPDYPDNCGFAQCVTRKDLDAVIEAANRKFMPDLELPSFSHLLREDQTVTSKSNVAHLPYGHDLRFEYLGKVGNYCPDRNKVERTPISEYLEEKGYNCKWTTPVAGANPQIKSYDASMKYIKTVLENTKSPVIQDVAWARLDYFKPFNEAIKMTDKRLRPLDMFEIANGVRGSVYIHPIDTTTAMGFPYTGKKKDYMVQDESGAWWFNECIKKDIIKADKEIRSLKVPAIAACVTNKMEARPQGKCARKIACVNIVMTALFRKYFSPIFDFVLSMKDHSESAVGINPFSPEWGSLWKKMKPNFLEGVFAIDLSSFDMRIPSFVLEQVLMGNIGIGICGGYAVEDRNAMYALSNWLLSAPTIIDGELLIMYSRMLSGIVGTSILDGQVLSLIQRACFHGLYPNVDFRTAVDMVTYGDDDFNRVRRGFKKFNKLSLAQYCEKLGMVVTAADKAAIDSRWDDPSEITFLKRSFVWNSDFGAYVGPLDYDSILKPLHIVVKSDILTQEEVLIDTITRSLVEMSFHGRSKWAQLRDVLCDEPTGAFKKSAVSEWKFEHFVEAWKSKYMATPGTRPLDNIHNVYGVSNHVTMNPASSNDRDIESYVDTVDSKQETLKSGAPAVSTTRDDEQIGVLSARSTEDASLGKFLERPIILGTYSLGVGTPFYTSVNFWKTYIKSSIIREKLDRFRYIRATAVLDIYFNASPKFYGKYIAAVNFPSGFGDVGNYLDTSTDNVLVSQAPCTYISVERDKAQLVIPFVCQSEYIDMIAVSNSSNGQNVGGWIYGESGVLYIRELVPLRYVGETALGVTCGMTVMMSLRDVEIRGTTMYPLANPASVDSTVHKINNIAQHVVTFASVAANIAESIGVAASILGFSRVNHGHEPPSMRPRGVGNTALCDVPTISAKLSVHKDQGVFVGYDPLKLLGDNDPELLCNVACKTSYITKFDWAEGLAAGNKLFSIAVKPHQYDTDLNGCTLMTSMCYAAYPFSFWSGTLRFSFEVICTFLHRGRLLFVYDSYGGGNYDVTSNRCAILDLTTDQAVTLCVTPNGVNTFLPQSMAQPFTTGTLAVGDVGTYGSIHAYVLNPLSCGDTTSTNDVSVIVYGSMDHDARFAVPNDNIARVTFMNPASKDDCKAHSETDVLMNNSFTYADDTLGMYFGETILSMRSMMQRFAIHFCTWYTDTGQYVVDIKFPYQGIFPGESGDPVINTSNMAPQIASGIGDWNFTRMTPLMYWSSSFIGMRGGIRWKAIGTENYNEAYSLSQMGWEITPAGIYPAIAYTRGSSYDSNNLIDDFWENIAELAMTGSQFEVDHVNTVNEVEIPYYVNHKFLRTRSNRCAVTQPFLRYLAGPHQRGTGATKTPILFACAAADDFSLVGFVGPVRMFLDVGFPNRA